MTTSPVDHDAAPEGAADEAAWADEYARALHEHLAGAASSGDEGDLSRAYELGRALLVRGVSVVGLAVVHHEALARALATSPAEVAAAGVIVTRAAAFFAECLSPFEMAQRGYREANTALLAKNDELRRSRDAEAEANRDLEAFSYSIAHDLRAPLRTIGGFSQALVDDVGDKLGAEGNDHLMRVRNAAERMAQLIEDLLRLSRVGRAPMTVRSVDVTALVRDVAAQLGPAGRAVDVSVQAGMRSRADEALLRIVIENLHGNALKFTSKIERASIEWAHDGSAFFVRDNGAGFDAARARMMFAPFQRFHTADAFEGTGIGLAIVHRVVRLHGGRIWAQSSPEHGATFYFTLGAS